MVYVLVLKFKCSLHEVEGLLESKAHLNNPHSAEATVVRQEAIMLDRINTILAGEQIAAAQAVQESENAASTTNNTTGHENHPTTVESNKNKSNIRASPTVLLLTADDRSTGKYKNRQQKCWQKPV
jgi:hypothetical protein